MKTFFELRESNIQASELDEMKEPFVVVDTADGNKVVGMASSEKNAKEIITTSQLPPMKIKNKKTLKIVKVKKKQMIGQPIKEEIEEATSPADLAKAMSAFKKRGGKVKKLAPGRAAGWHGKDDLGTDTHGMIAKNDTKKFKTKRGGKIKSMSADTQYDENYQVQKYTNGKKDGAPKSFGGNLKKATAHADKMGGDHRVHKEAKRTVTIDRPDRLTSLRVSKEKPPFDNAKPVNKDPKDKFGNPIKNRAKHLARKSARDLANKEK